MIVTEYMSHGALDGFLRVSWPGPQGVLQTMLFLVFHFFSLVGLGIDMIPTVQADLAVTGETEAQRGLSDFPGEPSVQPWLQSSPSHSIMKAS
jgi:hypothetical protein